MKSKTLWRILALLILLAGLAPTTRSAKALGTPRIVSINPPTESPVGSRVCIRAEVDWDSDFRSMRIRFGNEGWNESAEINFERCFETGHLSPGGYKIRAEVAKVDQDWGSATWTEANYQLTPANTQPPPQPPSEPMVSCSVNSFDVWPNSATVGTKIHISGSGSCNVNNVRATKVRLDGVDLYEIGSPSLEWDWNTSGVAPGQHKLKLFVAGQGDNNWSYAAASSNIVVTLSANQVIEPPSSPFKNSDVIDINGDIYVITVSRGSVERHLVPNPETLDALGISRSMINNQGLSNSELKSIHRGSDIPDVNRDYAGFITFKNRYFPNTAPIGSKPNNPNTAFLTGDVINIGGNIYVIVILDAIGTVQRRLVPNPETLDALGISRSMINNKGFSDAELNLIEEGGHIPDALRDPNGFNNFKQMFFPFLQPIVSGEGQTQPQQGIFNPKAPGVCSGWTTRLWIGAPARVTNNGGELKLRVGPSLTDSVITKMYEGYQFTVIGGPVCADGYTWWNIQGPQGTGWAAEAGEKWWMAPLYNWEDVAKATAQAPQQPALTAVPDDYQGPTTTNRLTYYEKLGTEITSCKGQIGEQNFNVLQKAWIWFYQKISASSAVAADRFQEGQCTWYVSNKRPDVLEWLPASNANAHTWDDWAIDEDHGALFGIKTNDHPDVGDIAVWEKDCGEPYAVYGHVAYVTGVRENTIIVDESNRNGDGKVYFGSEYEIRPYSCMKFLSKPTVFDYEP